MKRHANLWDALARMFDSEPYRGRWPDTKKAFAELSGVYSVSWSKRVCLWVLNVWKNYRWITKD